LGITDKKPLLFSVRLKFMLAFAVVIVVIIILCIFLFINFYALMSQKASLSTISIISQTKSEIELFINEIDSRSISLYHSVDTMRLIEEYSSQESVSLVRKNILSSVKDISDAMQIDINISVLSSEMRIITSSYDGWVGNKRILGSYWIDKISRANGERVIISGYNVAQGTNLENIKVISLARLIRSPDGNHKGILFVDIPVKSIGQICDRVDLGANGFIAVIDNDGYILYHTNDSQIGMTFRQNTRGQNNNQNYYITKINKRKMLVSEIESVYTGFTLVGAVPKSEVESELNNLRHQFFLAMALIFTVAILFSGFIAYTLTKPVIKMSREMKRVESGDFSLYSISNRNDEIGLLEQSFNAMLINLNDMIDRIYKLTIRDKEAQYKALSAVIHPHFIYNTLEAISMTAYMNGDSKVVKMLNQFANLLRFSTESTSELIPLRDELAHLENYIELIKVRKPELFDVVWKIDSRLLDSTIPKLTLQPIVENSVKHGFRNIERGGLITLSARTNHNDLCIKISDNGEGLSSIGLYKINEALHNYDANEKDYFTLKNINTRIRINFGTRYGLHIQHNEGPGITVSVLIPMQGG
jgi:two-component system, sensor histidine kinase YesM